MKREVRWGSPKQYQKGYELPEEGKPIPAKLPKPKSKYCKKLKGEHRYGIWVNHRYGWKPEEQTGLWFRHCIGCNRKESWLSPRKKDSKYWELDLDARPPESEA